MTYIVLYKFIEYKIINVTQNFAEIQPFSFSFAHKYPVLYICIENVHNSKASTQKVKTNVLVFKTLHASSQQKLAVFKI